MTTITSLLLTACNKKDLQNEMLLIGSTLVPKLRVQILVRNGHVINFLHELRWFDDLLQDSNLHLQILTTGTVVRVYFF